MSQLIIRRNQELMSLKKECHVHQKKQTKSSWACTHNFSSTLSIPPRRLNRACSRSAVLVDLKDNQQLSGIKLWYCCQVG